MHAVRPVIKAIIKASSLAKVGNRWSSTWILLPPPIALPHVLQPTSVNHCNSRYVYSVHLQSSARDAPALQHSQLDFSQHEFGLCIPSYFLCLTDLTYYTFLKF